MIRWRRMMATVAVASALVGAVATSVGAAGTTWRVEATPSFAGQPQVQLNGITCTSATSCRAVGSYADSMWTEAFTATSWGTAQRLAAAGSSDHGLEGIACPEATDCLAVGFSVVGSTNDALVDHYVDGHWTASTPQTSAGKDVEGTLESIACTDADACTAVGYGETYESSVIERWNGRTWTAETPAAVTGALLDAVSCPATNSCYATGSYKTGPRSFPPLVEHWNGSIWSRQRAPTQTGAHTNQLLGVSCTSPSSCITVGSWSPSSSASGVHVLIDRYDGTSWVRQVTPDPDLDLATLGSISCTSASSCSAVGVYGPMSAYKVLAERWNGTAWSVQTSADVGAASVLSSVACVATVCRAVGLELTSAGSDREQPLAEAN